MTSTSSSTGRSSSLSLVRQVCSLYPCHSRNVSFSNRSDIVLTTGKVTHEDYKPVITQIYPKDDPWLSTDTVFAVKDDLVVDFTPIKELPKSMSEHKGPGGAATKELNLDIVLAPKGMAGLARTVSK